MIAIYNDTTLILTACQERAPAVDPGAGGNWPGSVDIDSLMLRP